MNKPHCLVIAAGEAKRWNNYLGVQKHFAPIDGVPIIHRTASQIDKYGDVGAVIIVKEGMPHVPKAWFYEADLNEDNVDADKFLSSKELWNKNGRTIIFYGDVYFTDEAMKTIFEFEGKDWTLFARPKGSKITGCHWGECFAISFYPDQHIEMEQALFNIRDLFKDGTLIRCGGWELYKMMTDQDMKESHREHKKRIEVIDDWTEDFDFPEDYDNFIKNYESIQSKM